MENVSQFDLTASLGRWLERLAQSPHFRNADVAEMESHVRDSVTKLQSHGLSEEESFLIAIRRVGSVAKLEPEFAKLNRNWLNLIVHGLILIFFSVVCWFVWGALHLPQMMQGSLAKAGAINQATGYGALPAFTQMMVTLRDFMLVPPLLAFVYC
ncbi:MAG: permease prefix domain 1-containing protein, partial [Fimbriimonadaceae bacterium]